jgi:single-strand DNA-binding protein
MAKSLNKVQLIGNLTKDPELRYTPQGTAVCTLTVATNRQWVTEGEKKEEAEFTRCVAWQKLAEICGQYLSRGRRVYVEGRLQTRKWTDQSGVDRYTTEVVLSDMLMLDAKGAGGADFDIPDDPGMDMEMPPAADASGPSDEKTEKKSSGVGAEKSAAGKPKDVKADIPEDEDIPF